MLYSMPVGKILVQGIYNYTLVLISNEVKKCWTPDKTWTIEKNTKNDIVEI